MINRVAFLGPAGSYTEQAAIAYDVDATLVPYPSIPAVADAVSSGTVDRGVVPIENSLEGAVTHTLDLLIHDSSLFIRHELVLPIEHCLMVVPGTNQDSIQVIFSHPQALAQCKIFLTECFTGVELMASLSTSAAVEEMRKSQFTSAAIANKRAADLYSAEIISYGIGDDSNNVTRFIVLSDMDHPPTGSDKTSICFDFDHDSSGILFAVLEEIAKRDVNMTKIESRPTKRNLGRYIFLVDLEGHRNDEAVRDALEAVKSQVSMFKVLGSYPMNVSSAV